MILSITSTSETSVLDLREALERSGIRTTAERAGPGTILRCTGTDPSAVELIKDRADIRILESSPPYPLVARYVDQAVSTVPIAVGGPAFGGHELVVIAGPCSVESRSQLLETARGVRAAGAGALRGGAFKPRTSPYPFQGLGMEGIDLLCAARRATGLPVVTEVMDPRLVEDVALCSDVLQVGARNMQNYPLLDELGRVQRPVLLKRGPSATLDELLLAAERIVFSGNDQVILCERGIRTFGAATRNTLDISAVGVLRERTHLPVIVDPSHAAGRRELVASLALAAVAAGADGLLVEVHPRPDTAVTDGRQSLSLDGFRDLMEGVRRVAAAVGRSLAPVPRSVGEAA